MMSKLWHKFEIALSLFGVAILLAGGYLFVVICCSSIGVNVRLFLSLNGYSHWCLRPMTISTRWRRCRSRM